MSSAPEGEEEYAVTEAIKIVILGSTGVGKTALLSLFCTEDSVIDHVPTLERTWRRQFVLPKRNRAFLMTLVEIGGSDEAVALLDAHDDADLYLLVYSVCDLLSFAAVQGLCDAVVSIGGEAPFLLVGTQTDRVDDRQVSADEATELAMYYGWRHVLTSSRGPPPMTGKVFSTAVRVLDADQGAGQTKVTTSAWREFLGR